MQMEEISTIVLKHTVEIAAVSESVKSAHNRITENDRITAGIHSLAESIVQIATEIKLLTKRVDNSIVSRASGSRASGSATWRRPS